MTRFLLILFISITTAIPAHARSKGELSTYEKDCIKAWLKLNKDPHRYVANILFSCGIRSETVNEGENEWLENSRRDYLRKVGCQKATTPEELASVEQALSKSLTKTDKRMRLPGTGRTDSSPQLGAPLRSHGSTSSQAPVCDLPSGTCTVVVEVENGYVNKDFICVNKRGRVVKVVNNEKWAQRERRTSNPKIPYSRRASGFPPIYSDLPGNSSGGLYIEWPSTVPSGGEVQDERPWIVLTPELGPSTGEPISSDDYWIRPLSK